jgi:hypothetical protein
MKRMTNYFLLAVLIVVCAYDLYAYWWLTPQQTVSRTVFDLAREYPIIAFVAGVVAGHLFWPVR